MRCQSKVMEFKKILAIERDPNTMSWPKVRPHQIDDAQCVDHQITYSFTIDYHNGHLEG